MGNKLHENPNWFTDQLTLYQAANTSNDAIKRNFMIRIAEFELIIADLRSKKAKDPLQHELILGRRGSGKSTLLKRIQVEIEEDTDLAKKYIAINLAEEQAGIYRLSDLWFEVLQELMLRFNAQKVLRDFTTFGDNESYSRYLYAEIHGILVKNKRKVVLLLDNLDRILENFNDDGHLLRETLLNYADVQIIGGSTRMDEHFWQYDKPFYEFFRRHRLEGLQFEEMHELLNHWSDIMELPILKDYALRHRGKVEAIRILTDGLPRAMQFFIEILLHDSTLYGFDYLRKVMDRATPLYQERLNSLTAPQRKIVLEMAFWWEACPTKILAEKCRMEGKLISSFLKQLEGFGIVETLKTGTKNHLYRVSERFFNMWLIITQGNPAQKRHAKYLTYFIEAWYDSSELQSLTTQHIEGLKSGKLSFDKTMILSKAFSQSKFISVEQRDDLILLTKKLNEGSIYNLELPRTYAEILKELQKLDIEEKYEAALERVEEIENEEDGIKFYLKGYFYNVKGSNELAKQFYVKAREKGHIPALHNLSVVLYNTNIQKENALTYINQCCEQQGLDLLRIQNRLIIEIWNGIFENVNEKIEAIFKESAYENLTEFLTDLLNQGQIHLVLSLFDSEQHGEALKSRYELIHYAALILAGKTEGNLLLKIPPEVMPTVQDIVEKVKAKQAFYAD